MSDDNYCNQVTADISDDSNDRYCYKVEHFIESRNTEKKTAVNLSAGVKKVDTTVSLKIKNRSIRMKIDTGSDVNIIDQPSFEIFKHSVKLKKTDINLRGYNSKFPLKVLGKFSEVVESRSKVILTEFYVVSGRSGSLISAETAEQLQLIRFINKIDFKQSLIQQYPDVFNGIGKLKDVQVKLHVDKDVKPIIQPYRRIPFPIREKVEKVLDRLETAGVIEKVYGPTDWVSHCRTTKETLR